MAAKTEFDQPFKDLITEAARGTVWASDKITLRERSMLTPALLAATGSLDEIPMHLRASTRAGATKPERLTARILLCAQAARALEALPPNLRDICVNKEDWRAPSSSLLIKISRGEAKGRGAAPPSGFAARRDGGSMPPALRTTSDKSGELIHLVESRHHGLKSRKHVSGPLGMGRVGLNCSVAHLQR